MDKLVYWLQTVRKSGIPVLGICFGHQILAHAFGGIVDFASNGRELGTLAIKKTDLADDDFLFDTLPEQFVVNESHAQSVLQLPPGSGRLATNHHSQNQAFRLDAHIWGVQFHPEFSKEHLQEYFKANLEELNSRGLNPNIEDTVESKSILNKFCQYCLFIK
jgi:GMP synthase (glutamine-hydrolysing)